MDHWATIAAERRALADRLDGLTPAQWATLSLCQGWTVRHVAAHLVLPHKTSMLRFGLAFVAARGSFERANVACTAREVIRPPADLVADLRRFAESRFKPPGFTSVAPLTDVLIHSQDIGIPLGFTDHRPAESWVPSLDFVVTPKAKGGFRSLDLTGLRFVATDVDWSHGEGAEVSGPAGALALMIMGRPARAAELTGPGLTKLAVAAFE